MGAEDQHGPGRSPAGCVQMVAIYRQKENAGRGTLAGTYLGGNCTTVLAIVVVGQLEQGLLHFQDQQE